MTSIKQLHFLQVAFFLKYSHSSFLKIIYDKSKPNGTLKKLLDSSLANKNCWSPKISFEKGLSIVINDYLKNQLKKKF